MFRIAWPIALQSLITVGNRALALGVIGSMSVGTISLLFVVPAFFIVFQKLHERFQGSTVENKTEE